MEGCESQRDMSRDESGEVWKEFVGWLYIHTILLHPTT